MDVLYGVRMTGPLAPHATGLAGELARLGFTEMSARAQLGLAAHLSRWLAAAGLGTMALTATVAEEYLAARRAAGYTAYLTPKALAPLLGYLRELGVAPRRRSPRRRHRRRRCWSSTGAICWPSVACRRRWPAAMWTRSARSSPAAPRRAARI